MSPPTQGINDDILISININISISIHICIQESEYMVIMQKCTVCSIIVFIASLRSGAMFWLVGSAMQVAFLDGTWVLWPSGENGAEITRCATCSSCPLSRCWT